MRNAPARHPPTPFPAPETVPPGVRAAFDPLGVGRALAAVLRGWQRHPSSWAAPLANYARDAQLVLARTALAPWGVPTDPVIEPAAADRRYSHPAWRLPYFSALAQLSLLQSRWTDEAVRSNAHLPHRERRTAAFWIWQWQDALAPSLYPWSNPEVIDAGLRTGGRSLMAGLQLFMEDACAGEARMAPRDALAVGRDLAATPGSVVYRNELMELIQYAATTPEVARVPIVIVPPWINKYYILDLTPAQSLVRHLVDTGHTVFTVSWKNPGRALAGATFDDYLMRGVRQAIEVARGIAATDDVHAVGYCVGGTALAVLMAWLNAGGGRVPVADWTLLATLVDFSDPGPIEAFVNEASVATICELMAQRGGLDGRQMALTFRMLRSNTLIWHYVVHGYLLGEPPAPSAVLQWNMDTTRVPSAMHAWYLRRCYLDNALCRPGAASIAGRAIDLRAIRQPLYAVGCEEDHITPWTSTFATTQRVGGPAHYTLSTSGHILGIVNPPVTPPRRTYWSGAACSESAQSWRARQQGHAGSWWPDWLAWMRVRGGGKVAARAVGCAQYPPLHAAPGLYVHER